MDRRRPSNVPSRPLVLIVAEDDDARELYVQGLRAFGFEAIAAADCERAYRCAWDLHPDIIVTDLTVRGGDGWQLLHDLKREANSKDSGRPAYRPQRTIVAGTRRACGMRARLREAMST